MEANLRTKPWKEISNVEPEKRILMKAEFSENGYDVLFFDMISLWHEQLIGEEFEKRMQKLNPGIETSKSKILGHLNNTCKGLGATTKDKIAAVIKDLPESKQQKLVVKVKNNLASLPFVWEFNATPTDNEMISVHLIIPLMTMSGELIRQKQELYKLLKNKDKEIEDLKSQGVQVTRKHLETARFDEACFKDTMNKSKGFEQQVQMEGALMFSEEGLQLYRELMLKQAQLQCVCNSADPECSEDVAMDLSTGGLSPQKTPTKSPVNSDTSPTKNLELLRRQELEQRLVEKKKKKDQKQKMKKLKL